MEHLKAISEAAYNFTFDGGVWGMPFGFIHQSVNKSIIKHIKAKTDDDGHDDRHIVKSVSTYWFHVNKCNLSHDRNVISLTSSLIYFPWDFLIQSGSSFNSI